jgi:hypothetical protein
MAKKTSSHRGGIAGVSAVGVMAKAIIGGVSKMKA